MKRPDNAVFVRDCNARKGRKNRGPAAASGIAAFTSALIIAAHLLAGPGASTARAAAAETAGGVIAAMARFDRAFIPALALSNQGRPEQAKKAAARLESEWTRFQEDCGSYEKSPRWRDALARVDDSIDEAVMYVESGELPKAHELLEEVRDAFFRLREERSWEYYIDYLNRYHGTMEEVLREAGQARSEGLDEAGKVRLYTLQGEARARWEALSAASFDPALFGFDREKTGELQKAVAAVGKSLDALRAAFCEKDSEAVIKAALGLRPPYVKAYLMFGDFGGLQ